MTLAADLLDNLDGARRGYPAGRAQLAAFAVALMQPVEIAARITRPNGDVPGWTAARDPDLAPVELLEWLGQHVGQEVRPEWTDAEKRSRILHPAGFDDGKASAMVAEAQRTLTGTKTVRVLRMVDGSMWEMAIVTRTAETPDAAATFAAAMRQKPAGVHLIHVVSDAPLIDEGTLALDSVGVSIDTATLGDVT